MIQSTPEWVQRELMICIEKIKYQLSSPDPANDALSSQFTFASEASVHAGPSYSELQAAYAELRREMQSLRAEHEQSVTSLQEHERQTHKKTSTKTEKQDSIYRTEIDSLRTQLARSENTAAESEALAAKQESQIEELSKRLEDLVARAAEAERLKDEIDEYRHAAEKARKLEASVDKYKKKLEDAAEGKRLVKALQAENVDLLEKHARLEESQGKMAATVSLAEAYKQTIASLETRNAELSRKMDEAQYRLSEQTKLYETTNETNRVDKETISLLEERIAELESATSSQSSRKQKTKTTTTSDHTDDSEDDTADISGIGDELEDAVSGRTMTSLKLENRKLQRELRAAKANEADINRLFVVEELLKNAESMKARYEEDYLAAQRDKLKAVSQLEEIRNASDTVQDSSATNIALRMRLNETVKELDNLKLSNIALQQRFDDVQRDLCVAHSDLTLVDKDQVQVLAKLRESVAEDKMSLEAQAHDLKAEVAKLSETSAMQLSQINTLLMDKITLQDDGIAQRDRLLWANGQSDSTQAGSQAVAQAAELSSQLAVARQELETTNHKLQKARTFIRQQDKLFREQHGTSVPNAQTEQVELAHKNQVSALEDEIERQRSLINDNEERHQREQQLLLAAWQEAGLGNLQAQIAANGAHPIRRPPVSWLAQQRKRR